MKKILLKNAIEKPQSGEWGEDDVTGNGIPVIRTTNFTNAGEVDYSNVVSRLIDQNKFDKKVLQKGDIIIEKSGGSEKQPVGRVIYFEGESNKFLFNNFTSALRVKNDANMNSKYLFYYLFNFYKNGGTLKFQNKTTGLHNLKLDQYINSVTVPVIGINEQKRIVKVLDNLYKSIKLRQEKLEYYDHLIKSRFVEMFGDQQLNSKNFEEGTIRDIVTEVKYGTSSPAIDGGKHKYLRMNNITYAGELDLTSIKYIDIPAKDYEKYVVRYGDVLFNRTNSKELVGKTCVFNSYEEMIIAGYIIRIRLNERALPVYLSSVLNSQYGKETLLGMCKAIVGQANINAQELQDIRILIPPIRLQQEFDELKRQIDKLKVKVQESLEENQILFDSLMQKYFD